MITVKVGVQPPLIRLVCAVANVAARLNFDAVITAGIDGTHGVHSKHYQLAAIDVRTRTLIGLAAKRDFEQGVRAELGPDYDVLLEALGTPNEHLHVEFDPK